MPNVSIIVPCYKVEQYLRQCVDSLINQTMKDIEIILVDDGSPDKSGEICDEYKAKDNRIKVIHKKNGGVSAARNDGLKVATGEYVVFVDSDDYVPVDAYELLYNKAIETSADMVIGDVIKVIDGKEEYAKFFSKEFHTEDRDTICSLVQAVLYKNYCPLTPPEGPAFGYGGPTNKIVKRKVLVENNINFDESVKGIYDDIIYSAYSTASAKSISYINAPVYYYRIISGSLTQSFKKQMPEIASAILCSTGKFMEKYNDNCKLTEAYSAFIIRILAYSLPRYYCHKNNPKSTINCARELKTIMKSEMYRKAAKTVNLNKLTNGQRGLVKLVRLRAAMFTILYYKFICKAK